MCQVRSVTLGLVTVVVCSGSFRLTGIVEVCSECIALLKEQRVKKTLFVDRLAQ